MNLKLWSQNQLTYEGTSVPYELQLMPCFPKCLPHKCLIFNKYEPKEDSQSKYSSANVFHRFRTIGSILAGSGSLQSVLRAATLFSITAEVKKRNPPVLFLVLCILVVNYFVVVRKAWIHYLDEPQNVKTHSVQADAWLRVDMRAFPSPVTPYHVTETVIQIVLCFAARTRGVLRKDASAVTKPA